MRNKFFAVFGVAATLALGACSSSDETKSAANGTPPSAVNTPVATSSSNQANANTNVAIDGTSFAANPADVNSALSSADSAGIQSPQVKNRLDKLGKEGGPAGPPVDAEATAMKLARPAPDNSTFTSYLSEAGYEIRTFKNHPQLQKVQKITTTNGVVTIKVFLRNGKVIDLPGQAVPVLSTAPASQIMDAAGLSQPTKPVQPDAKKGN